jgi:hypothetical protein
MKREMMQDHEQEEENLPNPGRVRCDAAETEHRRDQRDHEEQQSPAQHDATRADGLRGCSSVHS